jgi:hypothetical protein
MAMLPHNLSVRPHNRSVHRVSAMAIFPRTTCPFARTIGRTTGRAIGYGFRSQPVYNLDCAIPGYAILNSAFFELCIFEQIGHCELCHF